MRVFLFLVTGANLLFLMLLVRSSLAVRQKKQKFETAQPRFLMEMPATHCSKK
jgi:hypothetical protein